MTSSTTTFPSTRSVDDTVAALEAAAAEAEWGHLATHDLTDRMAARGIDFDVPVRIVEICHPGYASGVLGDDLEISAAMPCRVSVFERDGSTWMSAILPSGIQIYDPEGFVDFSKGIKEAVEETEFALVFGRASGRLDNLLQHVSEDDTLGKALGTDLDRRFLGRSDAGQTQEHDQPSAHQLTSSPNTWSAVRWALMNLSTKGSAGLLKRSANVPRWMIRPSRINTI